MKGPNTMLRRSVLFRLAGLGAGALVAARCGKKRAEPRIHDASTTTGPRRPAAMGRPAPASGVVSISNAIVKFGSKPTGYKGAQGKVIAKNGAVVFTANASGNDVGVYVEVPPITVGDNRYLAVDISGKVFQKQGWAKWGSLQVVDADGKRFKVRELCQSVHDDCTQDLIVNLNQSGVSSHGLNIKLPAGLKNIKRIELVFVGETTVFKGFTLGNIHLTKWTHK